MTQSIKRIGLGSLSLLLFILGVLFTVSLQDRCYGDIILRFFGLKAWSNGTSGFHLTIFYSLIFFIPSFALGYKFNEDLGAASGRKLSFSACLIIFALLLLLVITSSL